MSPETVLLGGLASANMWLLRLRLLRLLRGCGLDEEADHAEEVVWRRALEVVVLSQLRRGELAQHPCQHHWVLGGLQLWVLQLALQSWEVDQLPQLKREGGLAGWRPALAREAEVRCEHCAA